MFYICYFTYIFHIYVTLNSSHPKDNATFSVLSAVSGSVFIHRAGAGSMVGVAAHFQMRNRIAPVLTRMVRLRQRCWVPLGPGVSANSLQGGQDPIFQGPFPGDCLETMLGNRSARSSQTSWG